MTPNPHKKQTEIPGAERPSIVAIDAIAAPLTKAINHRKKLNPKIGELRVSMTAIMKEHNLQAYSFEDGEERHTFKRKAKERLSISTETIEAE